MSDNTKGIIEARRMYAQAWADGTGTPIQEVEFTSDYLRKNSSALTARVRGLEEVVSVQLKLTASLEAQVTSLEALTASLEALVESHTKGKEYRKHEAALRMLRMLRSDPDGASEVPE